MTEVSKKSQNTQSYKTVVNKSVFTIEEQIEHFKDYLKFRIDIISNDPKRWLFSSSKYQLPTFEYYLQNCVIDKGGKYDFTKRNYGNSMDVRELKIKDSVIDSTKKVTLKTTFSIWMGTPFNYEDVVETVC